MAKQELDVDQMIEYYREDFERFPLPIAFDRYEEVKALKRRDLHIERVCKRWASIFKNKLINDLK